MERSLTFVVVLLVFGTFVCAPGCQSEIVGSGIGANAEAGADGRPNDPNNPDAGCAVSATLGSECTTNSDCCGGKDNESHVGGVLCAGSKCCLGTATGPCAKDTDCCGGECRDGQCNCIPSGRPSGPDERSCCSNFAKDGICAPARPGGSCSGDADCEVTKCFGRACGKLLTGAACNHGQECISQQCDTTCLCRKVPTTSTCCADVGGACTSMSCCFGKCGGDKKCACAAAGDGCGAKEDCCSGTCNADRRCCGQASAACSKNGDCCGGKCTASKTCCVDIGAKCTDAGQCCNGDCVGGVCCRGIGEGCSQGQCCGGLTCDLEFDPLPKSVCSAP
jgi:hypothetical protein